MNPNGTPSFAHSLLVIESFPAAIILGILPGINIPPDIHNPIKIALSMNGVIFGLISAAANVALSRTADIVLIQYKIPGCKSNK